LVMSAPGLGLNTACEIICPICDSSS